MSCQLTSEELRRRVEEFLAYRIAKGAGADPSEGLALLECDGPAGSLTLSYKTTQAMANIWGVVHGGVVATLVDTCMGLTCASQSGVITPTISMTINYARPVPLNAEIVVRTHTVRIGSTSGQMSAEVFLPERPDEILVTATGVYHVRPAK